MLKQNLASSLILSFYFKLKKMYKSAYMVQIMRSKRSIKEEGKGEKKQMYIISNFFLSNGAAEREMRLCYIAVIKKKQKQLFFTQSCSGADH